MDLHRTVMSFTKYFLWWYQYTSLHSQTHAAPGRRTEYRSVWSLAGPISHIVPLGFLSSYGTV